MTFADRVRAILNVPGWTQERLGAEVGVKQATVSRWLDGADPKSTNEKQFAALERRLLGTPAAEMDAPAASELAPYDSAFLEEVITAAFKAIGISRANAQEIAREVLAIAREGRGATKDDPTAIVNRLLQRVLIKR